VGGSVEGGIQAQPGDQGAVALPRHGAQLPGGKLAVGHAHHLAGGQPASPPGEQLAGPVPHRLVAASPRLRVAFRGRQHGQERPRPDPQGPGDRHPQQQADPAHPARFDGVALAGAHRILIEALGRDRGPPSPLDRVVQAPHPRSGGHKGLQPPPEPHRADGQRRPDGAVEPPLDGGEPAHLRPSPRPQGTTDQASLGRQDAAGDQRRHIVPGARCKPGGEGQKESHDLRRQDGHSRPLVHEHDQVVSSISCRLSIGQSRA